jgi:hypothetical protein
MARVSTGNMSPRGMIRATNRAAGKALARFTGLMPSSDHTGEDLALMMPDRRHARTERAVSTSSIALAGDV